MSADLQSARFIRWFVIAFAIVEALMFAWFLFRRTPA
jgi:hypothetical protein